MKEKPKKLFRRGFAVLIAVLLFILLISGSTLAEFTKSHRAKRVVAAYDEDERRFSAEDYLRAGDVKSNFAPVYTDPDGTEDPVTANIVLCNFAQSDRNRFCEVDIAYTVDVQIVTITETVTAGVVTRTLTNVTSDGPDVKVNGTSLSSGAGHYSDTLTHGQSSTATLTVSLPRAMLTGDTTYYLKVVADPNNANLDIISALMYLAPTPRGSTESWAITPTDNQTGIGVGEYAGYNFRLSGTGSGSLRLSWVNTKLAINEVFRKSVRNNAGETPSISVSGTTSTLTFDVDASVINSYDVQFYPVINADGTSGVTAWSDLVSVTCTFPAS